MFTSGTQRICPKKSLQVQINELLRRAGARAENERLRINSAIFMPAAVHAKGGRLVYWLYRLNLGHQLSPAVLRTTIRLGFLVHRYLVVYRSFEGRSVAVALAECVSMQPSFSIQTVIQFGIDNAV